jgi:hypothetical protein
MYDQDTKTNIKMHVWYLYSMHDSLAYGYSAPGVFMVISHAQFARKLLGSLG